METTVESGRVDAPSDFAAWASPHVGAMALLAARLAGPADRDDVVQESLLDAWRHRASYDPGRGTPRAWLLAITARRARRARLRLVRTVPLETDVAAAAEGGDVDLRRAVERLSRRQRLAVELHYFVGLGVAECAAVMGCAEGTVKSTLSDARSRLRRELGEDDG